MSVSLSPDRITGAILLVNEVLNTHSEQDAKRLHRHNWKDHIDEKEAHLDQSSSLMDAEKSELLLETVDRVLESIDTRIGRAMRLRFGVDGQFRSLKKVGEELDPGRTLQKERPRQLVAKGARLLRHPSRRYHLLAFLGEKQQSRFELNCKLYPNPAKEEL